MARQPPRGALKSASGRKADARQVSNVNLDRSLRDLASVRDDPHAIAGPGHAR
jgi:hypothetical protein